MRTNPLLNIYPRRQHLVIAGRSLWGPLWRSPMAAFLKVPRQTTVDWEAGLVLIPPEVIAPVNRLIRRHVARLTHQCDFIERVESR